MTTTLVLNTDFQPIRIMEYRRILSRPHAFRVVEYYNDRYIKTAGGAILRIPAVVVVNNYIKNIHKLVRYSKRVIYIRDDFTCQYTGRQYPKHELSIDHVIPRSKMKRSGLAPTTFENTVTCHKSINSIKGDRTPEEANLKLIRKPKGVSHQDVLKIKLRNREIPNEWKKYI